MWTNSWESMAVFFLPLGHAANFTVNDRGDTPDASAGDGTCADANGKCTLRAAVEERIEQRRIVDFVVDFEKADFMDSEGLETLIWLKRRAAAACTRPRMRRYAGGRPELPLSQALRPVSVCR
jgi:hypothetical protein